MIGRTFCVFRKRISLYTSDLAGFLISAAILKVTEQAGLTTQQQNFAHTETGEGAN